MDSRVFDACYSLVNAIKNGCQGQFPNATVSKNSTFRQAELARTRLLNDFPTTSIISLYDSS